MKLNVFLVTNTHSIHYCPEDYYCEHSDDGPIPYSCYSKKNDCDSDCTRVVVDLPLMNGNETARIFEDSISIWSVNVSVFSMIFCICVTIVLVCLLYIPYIRSNKKSFIIIVLIYIFGFIMLVGVLIGGIIFMVTIPYYQKDYSECFSGDISSLFPKLSNIEIGHMMLFSLQGAIIFSLYIVVAIQCKCILAKLTAVENED